MANSALSALNALNTKSLTAIDSVSFFISDAGTSKVIYGPILQRIMGNMPSTVVVLSNDTTTTDSRIVWEAAASDPYSIWTVATPSAITFNFTGIVMAGLNFGFSGPSSWWGFTTRKNGSPFQGMASYSDGQNGVVAGQIVTAPFSVTNGDYLEFFWDNRTEVCTLVASMGVSAWIQPLAIWV